jgi:hypothetical protein
MVVFIPVFLPPMGLNLQYIHYYRLHNFVDIMLSCVLPKNTDVDEHLPIESSLKNAFRRRISTLVSIKN